MVRPHESSKLNGMSPYDTPKLAMFFLEPGTRVKPPLIVGTVEAAALGRPTFMTHTCATVESCLTLTRLERITATQPTSPLS